MAKKASFKTHNRAGEEVTVYGEVCTNDAGIEQVRVWTKYANYGFYNLSRFENSTLTASSFRNLMLGNR